MGKTEKLICPLWSLRNSPLPEGSGPRISLSVSVFHLLQPVPKQIHALTGAMIGSFHLGLECFHLPSPTDLFVPEQGIFELETTRPRYLQPLPVTDPCSQWGTRKALQAALSRILISAFAPAQHSKQGSLQLGSAFPGWSHSSYFHACPSFWS